MTLIEFTTELGQILVADVVNRKIRSIAEPVWDWAPYINLQDGYVGSQLGINWGSEAVVTAKIVRQVFFESDDHAPVVEKVEKPKSRKGK